jgi:hypothetical protein
MSWVTNESLAQVADELGDVMLSMLSVAGIPIDILGIPDKEDVQAMKGFILADAMDYMALDPARLEQEYNAILGVSRHFEENPDAKSQMNTANAEISANWVGTASDAFALQVQNVVAFMENEESYMWYAAQGVSMMYALGVRFRAAYYDLATKTTTLCRALIAKAPIPTLQWDIVLMEAAKAGLDLVTMQSAKDLAKWAVGKLLEAVGAQTKSDPVKAADELAALNDYIDSRDRLKRSFEENLDEVGRWIKQRADDLDDVAIPLKEPVKVGMDVDSPDFSYDDFYYNTHDPNVYAPEVERERTKYIEEKGNGLIGQRLSGQG